MSLPDKTVDKIMGRGECLPHVLDRGALISNHIRMIALGCKNRDTFTAEFGNEFSAKVEKYLIECFGEGVNGHPWGFLEGSHGEFCNYLNSHDAIQRLIDGMSDGVGKNAVRELAYVVGLYKDTNYSLADIDKMNNATPEQKAEAVLKAYGRWTTTEEGL